jgi:hypothetical protein
MAGLVGHKISKLGNIFGNNNIINNRIDANKNSPNRFQINLDITNLFEVILKNINININDANNIENNGQNRTPYL